MRNCGVDPQPTELACVSQPIVCWALESSNQNCEERLANWACHFVGRNSSYGRVALPAVSLHDDLLPAYYEMQDAMQVQAGGSHSTEVTDSIARLGVASKITDISLQQVCSSTIVHESLVASAPSSSTSTADVVRSSIQGEESILLGRHLLR